jgi:hypothetical protein
MDDALARRLARIGGAQDVHRDEGRHLAAAGRAKGHGGNVREMVAIGEGVSL